jgi:hypothetical protein
VDAGSGGGVFVTKVCPTSPVDPDIDVFELGIHGAGWGTGDPVVLDGALALSDDIFRLENLAACVENNVLALAPHPLKRPFVGIVVALMPAGAGAAWVGGVVVPALPSGISVLESTMPELGLVLPTEVVDPVCCINRPSTPSTALKKFVEPALIVCEVASRMGASCCSSLRS